jgi:hypothetical protein
MNEAGVYFAIKVFSLGASGCLGMAKLMQALEKRRNSKATGGQAPIRELFPNGEKTAWLRALSDLREENELRRKETRSLRAIVEQIAERLKISV